MQAIKGECGEDGTSWPEIRRCNPLMSLLSRSHAQSADRGTKRRGPAGYQTEGAIPERIRLNLPTPDEAESPSDRGGLETHASRGRWGSMPDGRLWDVDLGREPGMERRPSRLWQSGPVRGALR